MKTQFLKIKQFFTKQINKLKFKQAQRLPVGVTAFNAWADSIARQYDLPLNDSVRYMLATMVLHAKEDAAYLSKDYFGRRAVKSAANQVAAGVMQELKQKQADQIKAEADAAAKAAEITTAHTESLS